MSYKTNWIWTWLLLLLPISAHAQTTTIDLRTQVRNVDFSGAQSTRPSKTGTALPETCAVGEEFFKSDAAPGENKYGCTAPDTWTPMGGGTAIPGQAGNDFKTTASPTVLSMSAGSRAFGNLSLASSGCTYTTAGGSLNGLAYLYFTDSGQVVLEYPAGPGTFSVEASGADCQRTAVTTPGWPTGYNFHPIATVTIANGHWITVTQYPSLSAGWYVVCGANMECTYGNGTAAIDVGANVMTLAGANEVTGSLNLAQAASFTVPMGAADPAVCTAGQQYFNTNGRNMRLCTATDTWADASAGAGWLTGAGLTAGQVVVAASEASVAGSGKVAPAGAFVGDTDAQTLTNKTFLSPVFSGGASGALDLRSASAFFPPTAAADPPLCSAGQQYFNTATGALRLCSSPNTWSDPSPALPPQPGEITARFWGAALAAGQKVATRLHHACTITEWTVWADQPGTVIFDVRKAAYADYPGTGSITGGGAKPALAAAAKASSADFTGWTATALAEGDFLEFTVTGQPAAVTEANITLNCVR